MARLHIGLSGYAYKEWQGPGLFYSPELKQAQFLDYYVTRFNALEADGTWYQMPSEAGVAKWIATCPTEFAVSPKMHRRVTHFARLKPEGLDSLKHFLKCLEPLEKSAKLGPILVQLPRNLKRDDALLGAFLDELPYRPTLLWSMEFRSDTWHTPEVEELLRAKGVAWVGTDTDDNAAQRRDTSDHMYFRMRKSTYSADDLKKWAAYFKAKIEEGKNCYVYCKHKDAEAPWEWADEIVSGMG